MAAFFGITDAPGWRPPAEDEELPPVDADNRYEIWPENMAAFALWGEVATQWTRDANGTPTGIDYRALQSHLEWTVTEPARRRELYDDIRVMEQAAAIVYAQNAIEAIEESKHRAAAPPPQRSR